MINPIPHFLLKEQLVGVIHPEQKIKYLKAKKEIISIQRGWYLVNNPSAKYSKYNIANLLYGPSYVSGLTVLSYLGWIADQTKSVQSMVYKRGKTLTTEIGVFEYKHIPKEIFSLGLCTQYISNDLSCLMANPTKALFDYLATSPNLNFSGKNDLFNFLEEDIRFDVERISELDTNLLENLANCGIKSRQINILLQLVKKYQ